MVKPGVQDREADADARINPCGEFGPGRPYFGPPTYGPVMKSAKVCQLKEFDHGVLPRPFVVRCPWEFTPPFFGAFLWGVISPRIPSGFIYSTSRWLGRPHSHSVVLFSRAACLGGTSLPSASASAWGSFRARLLGERPRPGAPLGFN